MYVFSREARLAGGSGSTGLEWATGIAAKAKEITGHEVQVWTNVYSAGVGTITWSAWFEDLTALEAMGDKLAADPGYAKMADDGAALFEGGWDDSVMELLYGTPDPARSVEYVAGATAVIAGGQMERAMGIASQLVDHGQKVTGIPSLFGRALTGPYGLVGWLTGYESLAQMEQANAAQAADPGMLKLIDSTEGCFVEGGAETRHGW